MSIEQSAHKYRLVDSDSGFVLVGALVMLLLLVVVGISATTSTILELQIAGIERIRKETFYAAEANLPMAPRLITLAREAGIDPDPDDHEPKLVDIGADFYNKVMGFATDAGSFAIHTLQALRALDVGVTVDHKGAQQIVGGGAEFGSGSSGFGVGAAGGIMIKYDIESTATGSGSKASEAVVLARYRYVPGTAGGVK